MDSPFLPSPVLTPYLLKEPYLDQIKKVLNSCDKSSSVGLRDYAVLMLLSRLGLRANEIALLKLDDINWHAGNLNIRGKGRTLISLPLLPEVGAALSDYLQNARSKTDSRSVFVRSLAPYSQFASSAGISPIAKAALLRAELTIQTMWFYHVIWKIVQSPCG
jgi:integrase|tara:strand:- start:94 stop:579 length:486 start_codon:yes stop_codon:yes gene_type:complete